MKKLCIHGIAVLLISHSALSKVSFSDDESVSGPAEAPLVQSVETGEADSETKNDFPSAKKAGRVSTRLSDDAVPADEEPGFKWPTLPKPKLPSLPKPSLPKLSLPSWTTAREMPKERARATEEPSTWQKLSSGTKSAYTKTKETLMPWTQEETTPARKPAQPPRRTPPKTAARTKAKSSSTEKKSIFPWFSKKEEKEDSAWTVNDYLSQPRIQ